MDFDDNGNNPCTLGFKIDNKKEMQTALWGVTSKDNDRNLFEYLGDVVGALQIDHKNLQQAHRIIQIYDLDVKTLDFGLLEPLKDFLTTKELLFFKSGSENVKSGLF